MINLTGFICDMQFQMDLLTVKINSLEKSMKKLEDFHDEFKDVLKKDIQTHREMWDEVYKRLETIELYNITHQIKRIAQIERDLSTILKCGDLSEIRERLDELEQQKETECSDRPHKCPICNGDGKLPGVLLKNPDSKIEIYKAPCHVCDETGIVWG